MPVLVIPALCFLAGILCAAAMAAVAAQRRRVRDEERQVAHRRAELANRRRHDQSIAARDRTITELRQQLAAAAERASRPADDANPGTAMAAVDDLPTAAGDEPESPTVATGAPAVSDSPRPDVAEPSSGAFCTVQPPLHSLAQAMSHELANIVSGIEGGTFRLIESGPLPPARANAAEGLWLSIRRLRRFHDKITAFVRAPEPEVGTTQIEPLLMSLRDELEATELGLQMTWTLSRTLPVLRGSADSLLGTLVIVSMALRQLERAALQLSIHVEPSFDDDEPRMRLELHLERDEFLGRLPTPSGPPPSFLVARAAAQNLLRGLGGSLAIDHEPGHGARALVQIPIAGDDASPPPAAIEVAPPATDIPSHVGRGHRYGGVLLLESDPTVRSLLASELKATGRAVFACADGAAARSLMQATPDRFELMIVDNAARLDAGDMLAATAARLCPELRVFVLSDFADNQLPPELADRVHRIRKPFGVHELRRALATAFET